MSSLQFHIERLSGLLQQQIQTVIAQELRDPRIPPVVTVTQVKLAQDTRNATVFVSVYGDNKAQNDAVAALNKAAPFIQRVVAGRITTKHFPRLYFKLDKSIEHSQHINELLKDIKNDLE
ncbi:MAG TPA: 30S ribosome-binding factor RbfA [Chitinispirillaceae bacterium]|nr:30S ribosome-binding factor RbfA [Chitinispirillaceae bacterium]